MSDSDIMLAVGLDYSDVTEGFQIINDAAQKALDAKKLEAFSAGLNNLALLAKKAGLEVAELGNLANISANQMTKLMVAFNELSSGQAKYIRQQEEIVALKSKMVANTQPVMTGPGSGWSQADAERALAAQKQMIANAEILRGMRANTQPMDTTLITEQQSKEIANLNRMLMQKYGGANYPMSQRRDDQRFMQSVAGAGGIEPYASGAGKTAGEVTTQLKEAQERLAIMPTMWQKNISLFGQHLLQWGAYAVALGAAFTALQKIGEFFQNGVGIAAEYQQQLVQINALKEVGGAAGIKLGPMGDSSTFDAASSLAVKYGDNINDVVQDLTQWYKTTGDLNNALFITNAALKYQVSTGTDLEDTYRTLTALANQATGMKMGGGDNSTFGLAKTPELLNKLYTAALVAGAGMRQLSQDGKEMGSGTANAAEILAHAMEQDTEALKSLGLNMTQAVAIDQSLITAMGNTGAGADSAAERISRLVGGFMELSRSSKAAGVQKDIGAEAYSQMQKILESDKAQGDVLVNLLGFYEKLNDRQKNALGTALAGNRQYQIMKSLLDEVAGTYGKIMKAESDKGALENTSKKMLDTFNIQVKQLQSEWSLVAAIIGKELLPALQSAVGFAMDFGTAIEDIRNMANTRGNTILTGEQVTAGYGIRPKNNKYSMMPFGLGPANMEGPPGKAEVASAVDSALSRSLAQHPELSAKDASQISSALGTYGGDSQKLLNSLSYYRSSDHPGVSLLSRFTGDKFSENPAALQGQHRWILDHLHDPLNYEWDHNGGGLGTSGSGGGSAAPADVPPKAARGGDIDQNRLALDAQKASYDLRNAQIDKYITLNNEAIRIDERSSSKKGMDSAAVKALNDDYAKQIELLTKKMALEAPQASYLQGQADHFTRAGKGEKDPIKRAQDIRDASTATQQLASIIQQQATTQSQIDDLNDKAGNLAYQHADYNISKTLNADKLPLMQANSAYSSTNNLQERAAALSNIIGLERNDAATIASNVAGLSLTGHNQQQINDYLIQRQGILDDINSKQHEYTDSVLSASRSLATSLADTQDKIAKTILPLSGMPKYQQDYMEGQLELEKEKTEYAERYEEAVRNGMPASDLNIMQSYEDAWVGIDEKALQYKEKIDEITSSAGFIAFSAFIDNAFKLASNTSLINIMGINGPESISSSPVDIATGITAQQEYLVLLQNQVSALQNEKTIVDYIYAADKTHTTEQKEAYDITNLQLEAQIKNIQTIEQLKQNQLNKPNLSTQLTKSFTSDLTNQVSKEMGGSVMDLIFGSNTPGIGGSTGTAAFTNQLAQVWATPTTNLVTAIQQSFAQSVSVLVPALNNFGRGGMTSVGNMTSNATTNVNVSGGGTGGIGLFGAGGVTPQMIAAAAAGGTALGTSGGFSAALATIYGFGAGSMPYGGSTSPGGGTSPTTGSMSTSPGDMTGLPPVYGAGAPPPGGYPVGQIPGIPGGIPGTGATGGLFNGSGWTGSGSLGRDLGLAGALYGLYQTTTAGGGFSNALSGAMYGAEIGSVFPGAGTAIGAGAGFLLGLFGIGGHDVPANMPDKYDTQRFTLYVGELQGAAGTAYGAPFNASSDPVIQELGGKSILAYIQNWIGQNINSSDPVKQKLAQQLKPLYGTTGGGLSFGHDIGDESVKGGSLSGTYVSIYQTAMQDLQQIMALVGDTAQPNQLVALNQFGGAGGSFGFSWNIPGYEAPSTPPGSTTQGGTAGAPPGGSGAPPPSGAGSGGSPLPGGGGGGGLGSNAMPSSIPGIMRGSSRMAYGYSPGGRGMSSNMTIGYDISIPLDGKILARVVQAYQFRTGAQGFSALTI